MTLPKVVVCGLGPGGVEHVTEETRQRIAAVSPRFVRTHQHPSAHLVPEATSFDAIYDARDRFDQVYRAIVEELVAAAVAHDEIVYVVPGSPLVLEETVRLLRNDGRIAVELVPAMSFLDVAWARLQIDPVEASVRLVDGHQFAQQAAGQRGPLLVAHTHAPWVLSEIKLSVETPPREPVTVLKALGTADEEIFAVSWADLDRSVDADHLTSLYIPELESPVAAELVASVELMQTLRERCPWDQAQDHASLRKYLLEETYEVLEVLDSLASAKNDERDSLYIDLEEELGDLWFQVLFHSILATEAGQFTVADVARTLVDKLTLRHPHVFPSADNEGDDPAPPTEASWEQAKRDEKGRASALDGIPRHLPALALADKVMGRASSHGLSSAVAAYLDDGDGGSGGTSTLGRRLLALVVEAREMGHQAETVLRQEIQRLEAAVVAAESRAVVPEQP